MRAASCALGCLAIYPPRNVCSAASNSCNWMTVFRRVSAGHVEFQLPLNITQHAACSETEQLFVQPAIAQLFLHQHQPLEGLLGSTNSSRRLETNGHAGFFCIFANRADHHQSD